MADEPSNPNSAPNNPAPPAGNPPQNPPGAPASPTPPDNTKMAEELGQLKKENEILKAYKEQMDPVLATLYSDEELLKQATAAHNKRLGVTPPDNPPPAPTVDPKLQSQVSDLRNSDITEKVNNFYQRHGIDKMEEESKKALNTNVGRILMDMLDPMGNKKDLKQVLEDVPLNKLDKFLEDAYFLATKEDQIRKAKEEGLNEASTHNRGIIGSMPSASANPDEINLSAAEKEIAAKAGWDEKKYLEMKKYIATRPQQGIY